jgi:pyridoxamine 5'-phosphate oxidase
MSSNEMHQLALADLRKTYQLHSLSEADVAADPIVQFDRWLHDALRAELPEPNAMTLATIGSNGRPSARIVLIKGYDLDHAPIGAAGRGFLWYTNYASRKARDLKFCVNAALQFHWVELERQVRIEGKVEKATAMESDFYFASRPYASRIGAWASPQSSVIADRSVLEKSEAEFRAQYPEVVPRPPHWGGYRLVPEYVEFWQGRPSRLHDRLAYRQQPEESWKIERLAP